MTAEGLGRLNVDKKIWWIPQVPMKRFEVAVPDFATAKLLLDTLAKYDIFQFENKIKPDYCNTGGLMVNDAEEGWVDFDTDDGRNIDELSARECAELDSLVAAAEAQTEGK